MPYTSHKRELGGRVLGGKVDDIDEQEECLCAKHSAHSSLGLFYNSS